MPRLILCLRATSQPTFRRILEMAAIPTHDWTFDDAAKVSIAPTHFGFDVEIATEGIYEADVVGGMSEWLYANPLNGVLSHVDSRVAVQAYLRSGTQPSPASLMPVGQREVIDLSYGVPVVELDEADA